MQRVVVLVAVLLAGCTLGTDVPEHSPTAPHISRPSFTIEDPPAPGGGGISAPTAQGVEAVDPGDLGGIPGAPPLCTFDNDATDLSGVTAKAPHGLAHEGTWRCLAGGLLDATGTVLTLTPAPGESIVMQGEAGTFSFSNSTTIESPFSWPGLGPYRATPEQTRANAGGPGSVGRPSVSLEGGMTDTGVSIPAGDYQVTGLGHIVLESPSLTARAVGFLSLRSAAPVQFLGHSFPSIHVETSAYYLETAADGLSLQADVVQVFGEGQALLPAALDVSMAAENILAITETGGVGTAHWVQVTANGDPRLAIGQPRDTIDPDWTGHAWDIMEAFLRGSSFGGYALLESILGATIAPGGTVYVPLFNDADRGTNAEAKVTVQGDNVATTSVVVPISGMREP